MLHEVLDASFLATVERWLRVQRVKGQLHGRSTIITMNTLMVALEYCQAQHGIHGSAYHREMGLRVKGLLDDLMRCPFVCSVRGRVVYDRTETAGSEDGAECYRRGCSDCG